MVTNGFPLPVRGLAAFALLATAALAGARGVGAAETLDDPIEDRVVEAFGRGDHATAERLLLDLLAADPGDPEHLYNLACAKSLQGDPEASIGRLLEAVDAGFRDARFLAEDPDLAAARAHPNFARVLAAVGRVAEGGGRRAAETGLAAWLDRFGASRYRVEDDPGRNLLIATALEGDSHQEMLAMLDAQADHLVADLFERYPQTPVLLIVARPEDAAAFFADGTTAGLYEHARRRLITRDIGESLRHEFTHLLHHAQMERLGQRHPIWIQEGLASLYESHRIDEAGTVEFLPNSRHNVAYRAARAAVTRPLRELVGLSHRAFMDESTRLYPQTRAIFEFIAAEAGLARFWRTYLETYPESPDGTAALLASFGEEDLDTLDRRWRRWVIARGPIDDSVRPGDASLGIEGEDRPDGVRISRTLPGGAARLAGVRRGDLLVAIDDASIRSGRELVLAIAGRRPGEAVTLRIRRGDATLELAATLRALPDTAGGSAIAPRVASPPRRVR